MAQRHHPFRVHSLTTRAGLSIAIPCSLLWAGLAATAIRAESPSRPRPNVLFIAVDDLRPELGCYGAAAVQSPNIDALAARGTTFLRAYCQQAVCNPSRASIMTGLRPDTLKVWDLWTDFRKTTPDAVTIPQHFGRHGYRTACIGKIFHNVIPDPRSWTDEKIYVEGFPFDPDAVYVSAGELEWLDGRKRELTAIGQDRQRIDRFGKWYLKAAATEAPDCPDNAYYDGAQTDAALQKITELARQDAPFFFAIGYYRPHLPFNAPQRYWDLYDRDAIPLAPNRDLPQNAPPMAINMLRELRGYRDFADVPRPDQGTLAESRQRLLKHGYYASVSYIDAQIGRLLAQLDKLAIADETIVVLWGDNGWKLGEHNSWCKMTNYEVDARVPLIIRAPHAPGAGQRCERLVELVDVYPTLCELAMLPVPEQLEGTSLRPLLEDPKRKWKPAVFHQFLREGIWVGPDGLEYMGYSVRTETHRYVRWVTWPEKKFAAEELYDHGNDPHESKNVVSDAAQRAVLDELRRWHEEGWQAAQPN